MEDVNPESRYRLRELFGEDAFYETLDDVLKAYRQQSNVAAPRSAVDGPAPDR